MVKFSFALIALIVVSAASPVMAEKVCVEEAGGVCLKYQDKPKTPAAPQFSEAERALSVEQRRDVQRRLAALGHYSGGADAQFGPGTRRAIAGWQRSAGFNPSGFLNQGQLNVLFAAPASPATPAPSASASASIDPKALLVGAKCTINTRLGLRARIEFRPNGATEVRTDYEVYDGEWGIYENELCTETENYEDCREIPIDARSADEFYSEMARVCSSFSRP